MADDKLFTQEEVNDMIADRLKREREHTFTQEEVNRIVADRLKREKDTLENYKAQMSAEAAAKAEADAMRERFSAAMGNAREAVHPRLVDLMIADFAGAVNDPANAGKNDDAVFSALFAEQGYLKPKGASWIDPMPKLPYESAVSSDRLADAFGLKRG